VKILTRASKEVNTIVGIIIFLFLTDSKINLIGTQNY